MPAWLSGVNQIDEYWFIQLGSPPVYRVFQSSSMVEHAAVNRRVVGSSPTSGAIFYPIRQVSVIFAAELLLKL